ncbi:MAG: tetratricopeptide repeat protein [Bacillota bacterium]|nr:tetratricopeptide repeat protein [Bacillota bacterium]
MKANNCKVFKSPYTVEREHAKSILRKFLKYLPDKKRGVLRVIGLPHSGRTCFLKNAEHIALEYNYDVIYLSIDSRLKTKEFLELHCGSSEIQLRIKDISQQYFENLISNSLLNNKKKGLLIIADNIGQFNSDIINILCSILNNKDYFNLALVYSNEPRAVKNLDFIENLFYETINLNPLSLQGLRLWLKDIYSWEPPDHFLEWFYNETTGLPGLIKYGISYLSRERVLIQDTTSGFVIKKDYSNIRLNKKNYNHTKNNLPSALDEFVGRKKEIEKINNLLDVARLVTLTGCGGIGKTRLALQVASMRLYNYNDGVFFVPLSTVTKSDSVISAIAKSINVSGIKGQHIFDTLKDVLKDKNCLIILDNFEHVIDAASKISDLLMYSSELTILVTSREPLRISGEYTFCVPPLDFLDLQEITPSKKLVNHPSVNLFLLRSKAVKPDFEITEQNTNEIIELCSYLEGIPLAIELAAANIGQISINTMISQSQNRLKWLNNGARDLADRQRTLRSTIEWGYNLLNETHKKIFKRLGVFKGKFDLAAVQAVTNFHNDIEDLSDGITSLMNKNFISLIPDMVEGEVRFCMLETIREYAVELFSDSLEESSIRECHSNYYLSLVTEADNKINSNDRQMWLEKLEFSHSNIIEALKHLQMTNNLEKELTLAGAMGYFWEVRGYWIEGISILESLVQRYGSSIKSKNYVKVYEWLGRLTHLQGKPEKSISIFKECLSLAREIGDKMCEAAIEYKLSLAVGMQGNLDEEVKLANGSLQKYQEIDYKPGIADVLQHLSLLHYQKGAYEKAEDYSSQSLKICTELNDKWSMSRALWRLGLVARGKGVFDKAMEMINKYLICCQELDDKEGVANALISLAELSRSQCEYDIAENYYMEALNLSYELGYKAITGRVLKDMGEIQRYKSNFNRAMELYEESLTVLLEIGSIGDIAWLYRNMAELELQTGNLLKAQELYLKALNVFWDSKENTIIFVFLVLGGLAGVSAKLENHDRSARLFGAANRYIDIIRNLVSKSDINEYTKRLNELQNKMIKEDFNKAWSEGGQMSMDMAIDYANEVFKDDKFEKNMANKMINFIHSNFSRDISLIEISDYFNMTPAYISTLFKYYTGYNYKDFLNSYRVKVSKELLQNSNLKINEVAEKVGCSNVNTFIRIFKKYEGMSPGQYYASIQKKIKEC